MIPRIAHCLDHLVDDWARSGPIGVPHSQVDYVLLVRAQACLHLVDDCKYVRRQLAYAVKLISHQTYRYCSEAPFRACLQKPLAIENIVVVESQTDIVDRIGMAQPKLSKLELQIMEALWNKGSLSIREIQEAFPEKDRPAYTTVQTTVYRLEGKQAVRRQKKISNAHIFEAVISRDAAQRRLIDELLSLFGGRTQPVMAHLVESGKLTLDDVQETEKLIHDLAKRDLAKKEKAQ